MKKRKILQNPTFLDHHKIYMFINLKIKKVLEKKIKLLLLVILIIMILIKMMMNFINQLNEIGLSFYKEKCVFRNQYAYKIIMKIHCRLIYYYNIRIHMIKNVVLVNLEWPHIFFHFHHTCYYISLQ